MSVADINKRIRETVTNHVSPALNSAAGATVPVRGENQAQEDENAGLEARLTILHGQHDLASIGSPGSQVYRYTGVFVLGLFDAFGEGTGKLELMADAAIDALRTNSTSGSLVLRPASLTRVGRTGGRWQLNVSCPFQYDRVA